MYITKTRARPFLLIGLSAFMILFSVALFEFEMAYAQENSIDTIRKVKREARSVFRSVEEHDFQFANQISVSTEKQTYKPGEIINFTIKNVGTRPVHFSGFDSDIKIANLKTGESFIPSSLRLSSLIPSGSSKTIAWNQQDYNGQQVDTGDYTALMSIGSLRANTSFTLSK